MFPNFEFVRPESLNEAVRELQGTETAVFAGGTELLGAIRDNIGHPKKLVSISGIRELSGITRDRAGTVHIGALTTLSELQSDGDLKRHYSALVEGAAAAASPQLRNQGTIGGNLCQRPRCWYYRSGFHCLRKGGAECYAVDGENEYHAVLGGHRCFIVHPSDTAPALVALGASLRIVGSRGSRTIPVSEFFLLPEHSMTHENVLRPSEIVAEVLLPAPVLNTRSSYRKVRARGSWDFALAGVALSVAMDHDSIAFVRVVLSGVAPIPWRARAAENALLGHQFTPQLAAKAAEASIIGATPLSQNGYKVDLVRGIVEES